MRALLSLVPLMALLLAGCGAIDRMSSESGTVPSAANVITAQLDEQILARFMPGIEAQKQMNSKQLEATRQSVRRSISIVGTVPVHIDNFEVTCPLARQMLEEVSRGLASLGYSFKELRKGNRIYMHPNTGEFVLTRNTKRLAERNVSSEAVLAGTYVQSPVQVRFSMRLLHTPDSEVLAIGTGTVPITDDVRALLRDTTKTNVRVQPSTGTRLGKSK